MTISYNDYESPPGNYELAERIERLSALLNKLTDTVEAQQVLIAALTERVDYMEWNG